MNRMLVVWTYLLIRQVYLDSEFQIHQDLSHIVASFSITDRLDFLFSHNNIKLQVRINYK